MATTDTSDDPSAGLIGSQLETYQQLIAMGFDGNDCASIAQIFGSNVAGAIDCVLNGGTTSFQQEQLQQQLQQQQEQQRELEQHKFHPKQLPTLLSYDNRGEEIVQFRIKPICFILIDGYIHQQNDLSKCMDIPNDIQTMIIKYVNFYFIKLNYNIHNNPFLEEKESKHMDEDEDADNDFDDEKQEIKDGSFLRPYRYKYLVLKANNRLREISKQLELSYKYMYTENQDSKTYYEYYVNLWIKFKYLKSIYVMNNKFIEEGKITSQSIDEWENKTNQDEERWVEVPCDFRDVTISDLDSMIVNINKKYVLELGIERYNQDEQFWPFRNKKLVPALNEKDVIFSALKSGVYQSSDNQNNTNNNK